MLKPCMNGCNYKTQIHKLAALASDTVVNVLNQCLNSSYIAEKSYCKNSRDSCFVQSRHFQCQKEIIVLSVNKEQRPKLQLPHVSPEIWQHI